LILLCKAVRGSCIQPLELFSNRARTRTETHETASKIGTYWHQLGTETRKIGSEMAAEISLPKRHAAISTYFVVVCAYLNRFRRSLQGRC